MKIAKRAYQKNFLVNTNYYSQVEINTMAKQGIIERVDEISIIYASHLKEVKVILEDGYYTTVAITNNGTKVYISI